MRLGERLIDIEHNSFCRYADTLYQQQALVESGRLYELTRSKRVAVDLFKMVTVSDANMAHWPSRDNFYQQIAITASQYNYRSPTPPSATPSLTLSRCESVSSTESNEPWLKASAGNQVKEKRLYGSTSNPIYRSTSLDRRQSNQIAGLRHSSIPNELVDLIPLDGSSISGQSRTSFAGWESSTSFQTGLGSVLKASQDSTAFQYPAVCNFQDNTHLPREPHSSVTTRSLMGSTQEEDELFGLCPSPQSNEKFFRPTASSYNFGEGHDGIYHSVCSPQPSIDWANSLTRFDVLQGIDLMSHSLNRATSNSLPSYPLTIDDHIARDVNPNILGKHPSSSTARKSLKQQTITSRQEIRKSEGSCSRHKLYKTAVRA